MNQVSENVNERIEQAAFILVCLVLVGLVIHTPTMVFLSVHWPNVAIYAKAWKEIILAIVCVLIAVLAARKHVIKAWLREKEVALILAFGLFTIVVGVATKIFGGSATSVLAGLAIDLRPVIAFMALFGLVRFAPRFRNKIIILYVICAVIIVGFACLELFLPKDFLTIFGYGETTIQPYLTVDKNQAYIRYNSFLRGPNPLGAYAIGVITIVAAYIFSNWKHLNKIRKICCVGVLMMASAALYISYSRAAVIGGMVAVCGVIAYHASKKVSRKVLVSSFVGFLIILCCAFMIFRGSNFVDNVIFHDNPTTGSIETSNDGHAASLKTGLQKLVSSPLGSGVGSTGSASIIAGKANIIENQYLFVAHELGWLGLALYLAVLWTVLNRLWKQRDDWFSLGLFWSGIGLLIVGLLLPVFADDVVTIVWWSLAGMCCAYVLTKKGKKRKI